MLQFNQSWILLMISVIWITTCIGVDKKIIKNTGIECGKIPVPVLKQNGSSPFVIPYGQFPWQVGIFYKSDNSFLCSGTLISSRYVLTSAFCLLTIETENNIEIRLGIWNLQKIKTKSSSKNGQITATVTHTILFPESSPLDKQMRVPIVALLRLGEPIDFNTYPHIVPICLPSKMTDKLKKNPKQRTKEDTENNQCFVTGWGLQVPDSIEILHESKQPKDVHIKNREAEDDEEDRPFLKKRYEYKVDSLTKFNVKDKSILDKIKPVSEPFSITIPVLVSDYQQAIYYGAYSDESSSGSSSAEYRANLFKNKNKANNDNNKQKSKSENKMEDAPPQIRITKNPDPIDEYFDYAEQFDHMKSTEDMVALIDSIFEKSNNNPKTTVVNNNSSIFGILKPETTVKPRIQTTDEQKALQDKEIESIEAKMYRHKEKYNIGKKQSTINRVKYDTHSFIPPFLGDYHDIYKRSLSYNEDRDEEDKEEENLPVPISALLKLEEVKIQKVCKSLPNDSSSDTSPIGKSCVVPINSNSSISLCLVDLGSPITCIEKFKPGDDTSNKENQKNHYDRAYLAALVTWKRPCFPGDMDSSVNVTIISNTFKFLSFLRRNMKE